MTLPRITDFLANADPNCLKCEGEGLVCEDHPWLAWGDTHDCGAPGMPCSCTG